MTERTNTQTVLTSILAGAIGGVLTVLLILTVAVSFQKQLPQIFEVFDLNDKSSQNEQHAFRSAPSTAPEDMQDRKAHESTIIDVVERVSPAVVSITLMKNVPIYEDIFEEQMYDPFQEFFGTPSPFGDLFRRRIPTQREAGTERVEVGGGTGFLVSEDGYIVTNRHVVNGDDTDYIVILDGGEEQKATVVARDPVFDIAVLKIEGSNLPFLSFGNSDDVRVGQTAIAIGNALAEFKNTVSVGVISGLARSVTAGDGLGSSEKLEGVIQTDAAINPGNSGGPLINLNGEVIGVNVAMAGAENIGFALPANSIKSVVQSVKETGAIQRPFLGIRYVPITKELQAKNALPVDYGVLVLRGDSPDELAVTPGSAADKAGIVENDIVLEIDGVRITMDQSLSSLIRSKNVGDVVELLISHRGETKTVRVTLEAYPTVQP